MDLAAALAQTAPKKGPDCAVCRLIATHDASDEIQAALADKSIQHAHLARALAVITGDAKWSEREGSISKHRRAHASV
jgi:hypothetical protein